MRAGSAIAAGGRHVVGVALQALLIAAIIGAVVGAAAVWTGHGPGGAGAVLAAKGGQGALGASGSWIRMNQSADGLMLGSRVTFSTNVVGITGSEKALVYLKCTQDGATVYGDLDLPDATFILGGGSSPWRTNGGAALCTGYLRAYSTHGPDSVRTLDSTPSFWAN